MIIAKPKPNTIFALGVFVLFCYLITSWVLWQMLNDKAVSFLQYAVAFVLFLIGFILNIRMFRNYKIISVSKGKLTIRQPFLRRVVQLSLTDLEKIEEVQIKTWNDQYKQLNLFFATQTLSISQQEYEAYAQLKNYVEKNKPKRKHQ